MATWKTRRSSSTAAAPCASRWGISPVAGAEHRHPRPLAALDPVDGRQRDARPSSGGPGQRGPQPRLEPGRVGVQVGHLQQGVEVVAVRLALAPAGGVEQVDGLGQARPRRGRARAPSRVVPSRGHRGQAGEVDGQVGQLVGHLGVVDALGRLHDVVDRPAPGQPLVDPARQAPAGPAVDLGQVVGVDGVGRGGDADVGQRGPQAGAARACRPAGSTTPGTPASTSATCGASSSDPTRASTATSAGVDPRLGQPRRARRRPARSPPPGAGGGARRRRRRRRPRRRPSPRGPDRLRHPHPVAGEQVAGGVDHRRRAAVVDLEGVLVGAGEVAAELGEEPRATPRRGRRSPGRRRPPRTRRTPGRPAGAPAARGRGSGPGTRRPAGGGAGPAGPGGTARRAAAARPPSSTCSSKSMTPRRSQLGPEARGTPRPGRARRPARPRPRAGRAGPAARWTAPRRRAPAGRC